MNRTRSLFAAVSIVIAVGVGLASTAGAATVFTAKTKPATPTTITTKGCTTLWMETNEQTYYADISVRNSAGVRVYHWTKDYGSLKPGNQWRHFSWCGTATPTGAKVSVGTYSWEICATNATYAVACPGGWRTIKIVKS